MHSFRCSIRLGDAIYEALLPWVSGISTDVLCFTEYMRQLVVSVSPELSGRSQTEAPARHDSERPFRAFPLGARPQPHKLNNRG